MNGEGVLYFENGEFYKGTLVNGKKQSFNGEYYYFNGNKYSGEWENDKKSGAG